MKLENGLLALMTALLAGMGLDMAGISAWLAELADLSLWAFQWAYRLGLLGLSGGLVVGLARLHADYNDRQADKAHNKRLRELELQHQQAQISLLQAKAVSIGRQIQLLKPSQRAIIAGHTGELSLIEAATLPALPSERGGGDDQQAAKASSIFDFVTFLEQCHHVAIQGSTGSGKTTLTIELLNFIRLPYPEASLLIIDPKNSQDWPIQPQITDVDAALSALEAVAGQLKQDIDAGNRDNPPKIILIDEHDWLFTELGKEYVSLLRKLFKVGREFNYHLILLGQSPLSRDNGLSQSDWQNFGRVILGNEAAKFVQSSNFHWQAIKADIRAGLADMIDAGKRAALITPPANLPYLVEIPDLASSTIEFDLHDYPLALPVSEGDAIQQMHNEGMSKAAICRALGWSVGGNQYKRIDAALQ